CLAQSLELGRDAAGKPPAYDAGCMRGAGRTVRPRRKLIEQLAGDFEIVETTEHGLQLGQCSDVRLGALAGKQRREEFGRVAQLFRGDTGAMPVRSADAVD